MHAIFDQNRKLVRTHTGPHMCIEHPARVMHGHRTDVVVTSSLQCDGVLETATTSTTNTRLGDAVRIFSPNSLVHQKTGAFKVLLAATHCHVVERDNLMVCNIANKALRALGDPDCKTCHPSSHYLPALTDCARPGSVYYSALTEIAT